MKLANKRPLPMIARVHSGARAARRAMARACATVSASEKRMRRREQEHASTSESLERMLTSFDVRRHRGEVMAFPPVGREIVSHLPSHDDPPTG